MQRHDLTTEQRTLADGLAAHLHTARNDVMAAKAVLKSAEATERSARAGLAAFCAVIANDYTGRADYDQRAGVVVVREPKAAGGGDA